MADIAVSFMRSQPGRDLTDILINIDELTRALTAGRSQVEWIKEELRSMQAFIEHVERREGSNPNQLELADKIRIVFLDAEDVIETFVIKSVKRRKKGVLYLFDKYIVGKNLQKISDRMREIFDQIQNYGQTNIPVIVEIPSPGVGVGATTIVAPALEKLDRILTQNLITLDRVIKRVEHVRDADLGDTQNIVSNLNSTGERSRREEVWLEEVKDICDYTVGVAEKFIASRERRSRTGRPWQVLCLFERYFSEWRLKKQVEYISTQFGHALHRRWTFGGGGEDVGDKIGSRSRPVISWSLARLNAAKVLFFILTNAFLPFIFTVILVILEFSIFGMRLRTAERKARKKKRSRQLKTFILYYSVDVVIFILYYTLSQIGDVITFIQVGSLLYNLIAWIDSVWKSMEQNLKTTQRYLVLMCALFSDIESAEGLILNERQKVWVEQLRLVTRKGHSLVAANPKDGFSRIRFAWDVKELLNEILDISDRKNNYGIANIQGRKKLVSSGPGPSIQGSKSEIIVEHNDNSGTEENPQAPPASLYRRITELERKFQLITGEKQLMEALIRDVREIGELDGRSKIWVDQMREIDHETEPLIYMCARELEHKPMLIYILRHWMRQFIMGKINRARNKIEDASRRRNAYGLVQLQSRAESLSTVQILRRRTQPSLIVKESGIVGFDEDVEVLMAQLLSDDRCLCITSIVGIEGTGKSTLARSIIDNKAVIDHFDCRVWVSMSPSLTVEQLLEDIAKEAATQIMGGEQDRWATQHKTLTLGILACTKYLIVVDGIETSHVLDTLRETIPDMSTGSRFLLTTRTANVARQAGTRSFVLPLQLLDDEHSWILFTRNLRDVPLELTEVGKKIVTKCGGLPSEILKMCELLSHKDAREEEWSSVVQEQLNQGQNPWSETFTKLPSYLRNCLFYLELFPANSGVPARRLVVLWVAEGLVYHGEDREPPELIAERYLTELIDLNMVQIVKRKPNGKVKICRLPNHLREFLLNEVRTNSRISQVADCFDVNHIWHNDIRVNTTTSDSASLQTKYKDVLSYLSFDAREGSKPGQDISNFLNLCISSNCLLQLRVLDLEGVYRPKLPKNIAKLTRLRYLGLRWTYLESLPSSISSLLKLQTLDLKHTYIHILTSSIWKMQLRHLFLSETYRTRFPPKPKGIDIGSSLSDLQTLWGLFVDKETPVKGGLDKLVNVRKLGITSQSMSTQQEAMESQLDAVADWIMKLEYLQSLRLKSRDEKGRPWNLHLKSLGKHINLTDMYLLGCLSSSSILSEFPPSLVKLTLSHSKLEDDPMQILKVLPNLRSLSLLAESYMGKNLVFNSQSFPQLYVLKVWNLEQLEEWIIEQEALPSLRQLEIRSCPHMKMLPGGLKHANTLLELVLTNMPMEINTDKYNIPPNCKVHRDNSQ